jgi:hypothetical protein
MTTTNIMSNYLENKLINHILRNTSYEPPSGVYMALYMEEPGDVDTGAEINGGGYARVLCPSFTIADGNASSTEVTFPISTASWGQVCCMGIRDASTYGNLLFNGSLSETLTVSTGNTVRTLPTISLTGNANYGWGAQTANDVLGLVLNGDSFPTPGNSIYVALGRSLITDGNGNYTSWTEISTSGTGYARQNIGTAWGSPSNGSTTNTGTITFTENAPANWGSITHIALFNSSSAGQLLFWGKLSSSRVVLTGDGLRFQAGRITVTLN